MANHLTLVSRDGQWKAELHESCRGLEEREAHVSVQQSTW